MSGLSPWLVSAVAGLGALFIAALLTEPLRRLALRRGYTDQPNARRVHVHPTPYLGGIAVAIATLVSAGVVTLVAKEHDATVGVVLTCAALIAVLGLTDDLRQLSIRFRLCVEAAAALVVVLWCGHPVFFGTWLDVVLAVAWILFTTNAFNLLDNMDGVVSTVTAITAGFLCCAALSVGMVGTASVMAALAGACAGFLFHNWHPARIFLGDAGSLFVGFLVSSATVALHRDNAALSGYTSFFLITLVVTADTGLVMVARRREGRPVLQGGRDHIAHRLRRLGLTVRQITVVIGGFAAMTCLTAVLVMFKAVPESAVLVTVVTVTVVAWGLLLRVPVYTVRADGQA
ncbi:undecaprenyl/decaprenyl-phosphate alpha-N-acetylglucosaminyl 1-phosphate transferase [Streptomyces sp. ISL-1]|uniref:MraY family glycosyltransferase n=1 Tax=Streptomyces sp. ISL-1 TaxID=2817657 RepID=UPI001BED317C|nr:MraY family glycosyltransferase [Streptomyces sp. ISL-1]MBT2392537.1 undecaprenyl/decaprenyl-phosphate alpha-N-acetylglucosaminyl 1-phosphate transferase [Streptomyces sp. ISL-1]